MAEARSTFSLRLAVVVCATSLALLSSGTARGELPTGYFVWSKGDVKDPASRKIYRMTLPGRTDIKVLTSGEDVQPRISPDGKWVAYAKAKASGGSEYLSFNLWKIYVVSIHGAAQGRKEIKIDDTGYWPSWGKDGVLYYSQPDGDHTKIIRAKIDKKGRAIERKLFFSTKSAFSAIDSIAECSVSPDGTWFAARTRGVKSVTGVGGYTIKPPKFNLVARAGAVGCMPQTAPSGSWAIIAGSSYGIRYGEAPNVANRRVDQQLIAPPTSKHKAYHPGIASDEKWVLAAFGTDQDHNSGAYDIYIFKFDKRAKKVLDKGQKLTSGGFNGWPSVWVGKPTPPPPPEPAIDSFYPASYTVVKGDSVGIFWSTSEADAVELDGEKVSQSGVRFIVPAATTRHTLVAHNRYAEQPVRDNFTITVVDEPQAVHVESFSAKPEAITEGQATTLRWKVVNATTLDVDGKAVRPSGTMKVEPLLTTEYTLTAKGFHGPDTSTVKVTVRAIEPDPAPLLPDSGGFVCSLARRRPVGPKAGDWPLWLLLALFGSKGRRRARRTARGRSRRP